MISRNRAESPGCPKVPSILPEEWADDLITKDVPDYWWLQPDFVGKILVRIPDWKSTPSRPFRSSRTFRATSAMPTRLRNTPSFQRAVTNLVVSISLVCRQNGLSAASRSWGAPQCGHDRNQVWPPGGALANGNASISPNIASAIAPRGWSLQGQGRRESRPQLRSGSSIFSMAKYTGSQLHARIDGQAKDRLLAVAAKLHRRFPSRDRGALWVGSGPPEYVAEILQWRTKLTFSELGRIKVNDSDTARPPVFGTHAAQIAGFSDSCPQDPRDRHSDRLERRAKLGSVDALTLAGVGLAIGLGGASALTRLVQTQLFGVQLTDLLTMAAASLGIVVVTALAGYIPARRATTIDPMQALRWE